MNSKVLNVLILLAMNFCCANSGIVSIVKSSAASISNWYDYYIRSLRTTFTTDSSVQPDADISFYEHEDINYGPSIQDENVVLMESNEDQQVYFAALISIICYNLSFYFINSEGMIFLFI